MTTTTANIDPLAEQAAQWIVLLTDDDEAERERARVGFEAWKRADPRHAAAAVDMERFIGRIQSVRKQAAGSGRPVRAALEAVFKSRNRRRARRIGMTFAMLLAIAVPTWLALQARPPAYLMADIRTATGHWQTRTLTDGTRITLGSSGAVNLQYDERRRTIQLVQGEILVDVAHDAARPFAVETAHGSIRALGTRFTVERRDDATVISMIESRVSVQTAAQRAAGSPETVEVDAGQRVRITADTVGPAETIDPLSLAEAWEHHQLVISSQPLTEVLDELARHRPGHILYDRAQIEDIRVNAVLPLDDTDRALQLLLDNFPALRIRTFTPYVVWVDAPPPPGR